MRIPVYILTFSLILGIWGFGLLDKACAGSTDREHEIKAAFIYKFIPYVRWPNARFDPGSSVSTLKIGVLGENAFWDALMAMEKKAQNPFEVEFKRIESEEDIEGCHILVFDRMSLNRARRFLQQISNHPVLTIGEQEGFAENGGVINFFVMQDRVSFEINVNAARNAGLTISSRLLKLARIVSD